MKRLIPAFLAALIATGLAHGRAAAQEGTGRAALSLDSLLSMPVSSAAKYDQKQTDAPAFVTIVTREEIRRFGYRTLEEVLQNQTGFYSGNDREYSDVGARGIGRPGYYNNKILLLVDGHTLNDGFSGGARLGSAMGVDLDTVERIEIVRGPGSAIYGARAMLAVVNLETRKGRDVDGMEAIGDLGTMEALGASMSFGKVFSPESDLAVSASFASTAGPNLYFPELDAPIWNHGVAEDLDWDRHARGLVTYRNGGLVLQGSVAGRYKGIPTGAYGTSFNHPEAESRDVGMFAEVGYTRGFGSSAEATIRGYADSYENVGFYPFSAPSAGGGSEPEIIESFIGIGSFGSEVRLRWDPNHRNRLVFGVEGQRVFRANHSIEGVPESQPPGNHPYTIVSGFIHDEFQITPQLALTLGVRRDEYSSRGSATTPRGALVYHPWESTTLKLLAGEAFRAPNVLEMYVYQPSAALLGNPDLDPEEARSLEMIWEQRFKNFATTITAFHNEVHGLIDLVEIQAPDSLSQFGQLAFEQQNISDAEAVGFEVEARAALPLGFLARIGYGFTKATDASNDEPLVNAPRHLFRVSASGAWDGLGAMAVTLRAESGRRTRYGSDTDPSGVVDLALTSPSYLDRLDFQLILKNLFDEDYSVPGGFQHVQSAIPQPGRTVTLRAVVTW